MNFEKPYYAVIFKSKLRPDASGYEEMSLRMSALAKEHPGFLGIESSRDNSGFGITVSYWTDMSSIKKWKNHHDHRIRN